MQTCHWPGREQPALETSVTTLGVFDGVHVGHQRILRQVVEGARRAGGAAVVVTFDRHPRRVLGGSPEPCITSLGHRLRLFESFGVDVCVVIRFTRAVAAMPAAEFARKVLRDLLKTRLLIVGPDCRFGRDGQGDIEMCRRMSAELGLVARQVEAVRVGGEVVSSTAIRRAIEGAELERAARLLGRPFSLFGTVVGGAGLGRRLGYPTANLDVHNELMPRDGVYAGRAWVESGWRACVTSVGPQPSFPGRAAGRPIVEVHILDAALELYGKDLEVQFLQLLREQKRFATPEALAEQIGRDVAMARQALAARAAGA